MKYSECVEKVRTIILEVIEDDEVKFDSEMDKCAFYKKLAGDITFFIFNNIGLENDSEDVIYECHEKLCEEVKQ